MAESEWAQEADYGIDDQGGMESEPEDADSQKPNKKRSRKKIQSNRSEASGWRQPAKARRKRKRTVSAVAETAAADSTVNRPKQRSPGRLPTPPPPPRSNQERPIPRPQGKQDRYWCEVCKKEWHGEEDNWKKSKSKKHWYCLPCYHRVINLSKGSQQKQDDSLVKDEPNQRRKVSQDETEQRRAKLKKAVLELWRTHLPDERETIEAIMEKWKHSWNVIYAASCDTFGVRRDVVAHPMVFSNNIYIYI